MADPVTIGLVLSAVSSAVGGIKANNVAKSNAKQARAIGAANEEKQRRESARRLGAQRARSDVDDTDLLVDSALEAELDALTLRNRGEVQALNFESEGKTALFEGVVGAGTSLLSARGGGSNTFELGTSGNPLATSAPIPSRKPVRIK